MTRKQKKVLKEVIEATAIYRLIIENNLALGARMSKTTLKEMADGMNMSYEKLQGLLKG